jgi:tRNA-(ms[2]io[6]A)-hydroxylase
VRSETLPLQSRTDPRWIDVALANLDAVLMDHAHCEKKAAAAALSLVSTYPGHSDLVRRCIRLAQEELRHFQQVHEILRARDLTLGKDLGDPYAQQLQKLVRSGGKERLTDRLLVCALIEARSCERLELLAEGLSDPELAGFYKALAAAEAGHFKLFVDLAKLYDDPSEVETRFQELAREEADIVARLPSEPRIH